MGNDEKEAAMNPRLHCSLVVIDSSKSFVAGRRRAAGMPYRRPARPTSYPKVWRRLLRARGRVKAWRSPLRWQQQSLRHDFESVAPSPEEVADDPSPGGPLGDSSQSGRLHV